MEPPVLSASTVLTCRPVLQGLHPWPPGVIVLTAGGSSIDLLLLHEGGSSPSAS